MNEHIKQLAQQAGLKVESWMTNPPKPFQILGSTEQFEKFAELIIGECAERLMQDDFGSVKSVMRVAGARLKEHFGIEE